MTTNPPNRIDRLEALAETILLAIQQQQVQTNDLSGSVQGLQETVQASSAQISELRASVLDTVQMVGTLASEMNLMHSEIRGLQTENRRILDRLERHMGDAHGGEQ